MQIELKVTKLHPNAKIPIRFTAGSAGIDLYAIHGVTLFQHTFQTIGTGIAIEIPKGYYGLIKERSGLAKERGIFAIGGVIDSDYRGEIKVILSCQGSTYLLNAGVRIAQLLITPIPDITIIEVVELSKTDRAKGGFGSTGQN